MKRYIFVLLLLFIPKWSSLTEIYRQIDDQGGILFTDKPNPAFNQDKVIASEFTKNNAVETPIVPLLNSSKKAGDPADAMLQQALGEKKTSVKEAENPAASAPTNLNPNTVVEMQKLLQQVSGTNNITTSATP